MRFDIDVAFCDEQLKVLETVRMRRWRVGMPRPGAHSVLEAGPAPSTAGASGPVTSSK